MAFRGTYLSHVQEGIYKRHNSFSAEHGIVHADTHNVSQPHGGPRDEGVTSASPDSGSSGEEATSGEFAVSHYLGLLDTELTVLTKGQRHFFITMVTILCCLSILGNVSTLVVNLRRKIRPFFRACLISLALSDLTNTLFLSTAYLSQFTEEYVQTWRLGSVMCSLVPFATTAAILASSMTLVGIAVDRYYAVMKAVIGFWNPTVISCIVCMFCIWLSSIGIASPVFTIYALQSVYILTEEQPTAVPVAAPKPTNITAEGEHAVTTRMANSILASTNATKAPWTEDESQEDLTFTLIKEQGLVEMCISEQKDVSMYYIIVFAIIFIPCIGAFLWFNIIIARRIWKRRHSLSARKQNANSCQPQPECRPASQAPIKLQSPQYRYTNTLKPPLQNCKYGTGQTTSSTLGSGGSSSATVTTNSSDVITACKNASTNNCRQARHLRMFTIILLMMAVFVFLRLPAWIFLLMRLYGSYNSHAHWILYFVFGIMNLTSSVLNPLFYTFLTETIQYAMRVKTHVTALICIRCPKSKYDGNTDKLDKVKKSNLFHPQECEKDVELNCCKILRGPCDFLQCCTSQMQQQQPAHLSGSGVHDTCRKDSNDKDEGVDCSEELEEDTNDMNTYNQRIYTIYPESLVSSSMNSK